MDFNFSQFDSRTIGDLMVINKETVPKPDIKTILVTSEGISISSHISIATWDF